jgi:hypothetical protein
MTEILEPHWNRDLRDAVLAALAGTATRDRDDEYRNMISGVAEFVAIALTVGPNGLPNAPWADDIAQFLVGALQLDAFVTTEGPDAL